MNMRKVQATALLFAALISLALFCVSMLVVWRAYFEVNHPSGPQFFRICPSSGNAECVTFTWPHLMAFCLLCLVLGALLATFGVKKWRASVA